MRAVKLVSRSCTFAVMLGATIFMPGVAQAAPAVMKISSHLFPSGAVLPGGMSGSALVSARKPDTLTAPAFIYEPPPAGSPTASGTVYEFMFWDVNSTLKRKATAKFVAPTSGTIFPASAWYLATGGGGCVGTCPTAATTWAFSLDTDTVLAESPIESVLPATAWTSPSSSVSTSTAVNITASEFLGSHTKFSFTGFRSWFVFGGGKVKIKGANLTVPAGESPYAIAFYLHGGQLLTPKCPGGPTTCM